MNKVEVIIYGIFTALGLILIGGYLAGTLRFGESIEIYRWLITIIVTVFFGSMFLTKYKFFKTGYK